MGSSLGVILDNTLPDPDKQLVQKVQADGWLPHGEINLHRTETQQPTVVTDMYQYLLGIIASVSNT